MQILIADDHPFTLSGTKFFVESLGYHVQYICSNGITALNHIKSHRIQLAILDINMPGLDGLDVLTEIKKQKLSCKVVLLTMHNERSIFTKAEELGAYGYILKEQAQTELQKCLAEVTRGNKYFSQSIHTEQIKMDESEKENQINSLSFSERKVLELVSQQKTSKQIAELLFISEKTVEVHRKNIISKLKIPKEKNALLIWAMKNL
ncbi:MAG: response regulator [Spirosomataceae bacterium]